MLSSAGIDTAQPICDVRNHDLALLTTSLFVTSLTINCWCMSLSSRDMRYCDIIDNLFYYNTFVVAEIAN